MATLLIKLMVGTFSSAGAIAVPVPVIEVEKVEEDDALVSVVLVIVMGKATIKLHACLETKVEYDGRFHASHCRYPMIAVKLL